MGTTSHRTSGDLFRVNASHDRMDHLDRSDERAAQLGDGVQKVSPRFQDSELSREHQASERATSGMVQQASLQRLYHLIHACESRRTHFQAQDVVLYGPRRGAHDQKFQISAVEHFAHVSLLSAVTPYGNALTK